MVKVNVEKIKELQRKTECIRNICILAHVDHGKTTLADSLIASNEIISQKLAGQLRYMDSRTDEQERQITMKCSSISLYHKSRSGNGSEYLINLIDSPGHVDFSSEVSTAIRLCDGAVIIVDAVEGVCAQTRVCLQQAYNEHLKPVLFINKIDRLIMEMNLSPSDAYKRLTQILEQINAVLGNIFASDVISKETVGDAQISALEDSDDSALYFDPLLGNVIFGSALDNWGFTIDTFASLCAQKLQLDTGEVQRGLWGNYYYSQAKKRVEHGAFDKGRKPMFVSLILEPIWKIYGMAMDKKSEEFENFAKKLGLNLTKRDLNFVDPKVPIKALFSQWLSLHHHLFEMIVTKIPGPNSIGEEKLYKLLSTTSQDIKLCPEETQTLPKVLSNCDPEHATIIAFVSKIFAVNSKTSPDLLPLVNNSNEEVFLAFARVYSGTLRVNQKILVLGPKHNPNNVESSPYITEVTVKHLFLLMGRNLESIAEVPAGNIVGIGGLDNAIFKTATLSTTPYCPSFIDLPKIATPILRVAVEPKNLQDMPQLVSGLKLLNQADPCVQVLIQETGEHVILTLGEVHLERCVKDLQETFAKVEIQTSKPIVPFRETIVKYVPPDDVQDYKPKTRDEFTFEMQTANKLCKIIMRAAPLPPTVASLLESYSEMISNLIDKKSLNTSEVHKLEEVKINLKNELLKNETDIPFTSIEQIWSLAPKKVPTNILLNCTDYKNTSPFFNKSQDVNSNDIRSKYDNSFINGFQLATQCGPICEEPMQGVCFMIESWEIDDVVDANQTTNYGPFSGQIISIIKEACKRSFQLHPQRLVTPMYTCTIVADMNVLNKLYAVIGKRNGEIVSADLIEGSGQFSVTATLPVIESFNFAKQIRTETSGLAMPQLVFSHWQVLEMDPYWVPTTKEEIEQYGDKADSVNVVWEYMNSVRERKGLYVERKIVEHAEKQRTLSKNK